MSIAPNLAGLPMDVLQKAVLGQMPDIAPYAALSQLQKMVKDKQMQQSMQGQQAMTQAQQMQGKPPIAQQVMQAAQGIDSIPTPQKFAGGGIVSFADGGLTMSDVQQAGGVPFYPPGPSEERDRLNDIPLDFIKKMYGGVRDAFNEPGLAWNNPTPPAKTAGHSAPKFDLGGSLEEQIRTLSEALRTPGIAPEEKAVITEQLVKLMAMNKGVVPAPVTPPQPQGIPAAVTAAKSNPAVSPGGIAGVAARQTRKPNMADTTGLDTATNDLTSIIQAQGQPNEELVALQKKYMEAGEKAAAEREARAAKRAAENTGPAGFFSNAEQLGAAADAARRGGIAGAAGAASKVYGQQEALRRGERDKIDAIADANQQYRQALLEKQMAFRTDDVNRQRQADVKVAEAKLNLAKVKTDLTEKELERQNRLDVADIGADSRVEAVLARAGATGGTSELKLMAMREKALDNVRSRLKDDPMLARKISKDTSGTMYQNLVNQEMLAIGVPPSMIGATSAQPGAGAVPTAGWGDLIK